MTYRLLLLTLVGAVLLQGQDNPGAINGTVKHSSGPIENASVVVTNGTEQHQTTTNSRGQYTVPNLPLAVYSVSVSKDGQHSGQDGIPTRVIRHTL